MVARFRLISAVALLVPLPPVRSRSPRADPRPHAPSPAVHVSQQFAVVNVAGPPCPTGADVRTWRRSLQVGAMVRLEQ